MKLKLTAAAIAVSLTLGGCATTDAPDVDHTPIRIEADTNTVPTWFIEFPQDTEKAIYAAASGISDDLQFSIDKAMHDAKVILADKLGATMSADMKRFVDDTSAGGMGNSTTATKKVSNNSFKNVDVSQYKVWGKAVYREGGFFRTYVLIGLGDFEGRKPSHVNTVNTFSEEDKKRADEAFKEITLN